MTGRHDGFFSVGRNTLIKASELGINPGTALLVLARGTGGDNITTKWSAEAAADRLGIRWASAKKAINELVAAGVAVSEPGPRPKYELAHEGDQIWLPNSIVDGVGDELKPVLKLRQTQNPMILRLFVELYGEQNLREDGGISRSVIEKQFDREKIGQSGANVVWHFSNPRSWVKWGSPATDPHRNANNKQSPGDEFFSRISALEHMGLIEWVPYLYEGPEGEPIHPLAWNGMEMERDLYAACVLAARSLLTEGQKDWLSINRASGWLVPAPAHIAEVCMFGIARLKYRPHTRMTAAWWADYQKRCEQFTAAYTEISTKGDRLCA